MTSTEQIERPNREAELVAMAAEIGMQIGKYSRQHDIDGTFVTEAFELLRSSGFFGLAVPSELGGLGATVRETTMAQRELARHCSSAALASSMHHHVVLATAWRYRRGAPGAEASLRKVTENGVVFVSTGGADQTRPRGEATKVDGGYRVSGRKIFCSQSPFGTTLATMFPYDDPEEGRIVLNMAVPITAEGVQVLDNWDTLGMRGTGSNDVVLDNVFVADEQVIARRPYATLDPPFQLVLCVAIPVISGVYLGIAQAARDHAVAMVTDTPRADDPIIQRQVGLMDTRLKVAGWALDGSLAAITDDPQPSLELVASAQAAKREISLAGIEVCDLAMEVGGGAAFFRSSPIEQAYRDIRGLKYHPFGPEDALVYSGKVALGLRAEER